MAANNDDSKKTSYTQALEGYKGQSLPSTGIPVKIREVFLDSMLHYGFDADAVSTYKVAAFLTHLEIKGFLGLQGRNKKSNNPETDDLDFHQKATFAIEHNNQFVSLSKLDSSFAATHKLYRLSPIVFLRIKSYGIE